MSALQPSPDVIAQRIGDTVVLVHLHTNRMYDLNRTAARLWELVSEGQALAEVRARLLAEFAVEPQVLGREMDAILERLRREDLLREPSPAEPAR